MADKKQHREENLEHKMNDKESKGFMRKAFDFGFNLAVAAGTTALGVATAGSAAPMIAGAFAGGGLIGSLFSRKKTGSSLFDLVNNSLKTYSAVSTVLYPMIWLGDVTYPLFSSIGAGIAGNVGSTIAKSLYALTAYNYTFIAAFKGMYHLFENKFNPAGMGKTISTDFWPLANRFSAIFAPGYLLSANGIPNIPISGYNVPVFAANALPAAIYSNANPIMPKKQQARASSGAAQSQMQLTPQQIADYFSRNPDVMRQYLPQTAGAHA